LLGPAISASGGVFTAHYYHKCNTINDVTFMLGQIRIYRDIDNERNRANDEEMTDATRLVVDHPQVEGAGTTTWKVGADHGDYYAREIFTYEPI
jgi:hypothetical protein